MDEIVIKHELYTKNQCHTCLSIGRKLKPIGAYFDIYKKIVSDYPQGCHLIGPDNFDKDIFQVLLCWECQSVLKKAKQFQEHVRKANEMLQFGQKYLHITLSNLTTILLNETHPNIIYLNEASVKTEKNCESTPEVSDNDYFDEVPVVSEIKPESTYSKDIKKTSKWAIKRSQKNQKPKFKIIENYRKCYSSVKLGVEEMGRVIRKGNKSSKSKLKCPHCSDSFKKLSLLVEHKKECKKDTVRYVCDLCKKKFVDKRHLSTHIKKHYRKYLCRLCPYLCYDYGDIRIHAEKVHKIVFECSKCGLKFGKRREFFKHYKVWHEKFICDYCGISFKMRYSIKDHIRKQHTPFECKPCNKRFARYGGYWLHKKTRHSTPTAGAYCVECDKSYADVYRYRQHLNNSARHKKGTRIKRRYPCSSCDKVFTKNIYMKDHFNLVHLKIHKNRCEECDKNFVRNADLVSHKRRVHEGILPPKNKICYLCGRGFSTRKILTNHVRTHTGERPFACSCGAKFAQSTALKAHARARGHASHT